MFVILHAGEKQKVAVRKRITFRTLNTHGKYYFLAKYHNVFLVL